MKSPIVVKKSNHITKLGNDWDYYFYYALDENLDNKITTVFENYFEVEKTEENMQKMQKEINDIFEEWTKE